MNQKIHILLTRHSERNMSIMVGLLCFFFLTLPKCIQMLKYLIINQLKYLIIELKPNVSASQWAEWDSYNGMAMALLKGALIKNFKYTSLNLWNYTGRYLRRGFVHSLWTLSFFVDIHSLTQRIKIIVKVL